MKKKTLFLVTLLTVIGFTSCKQGASFQGYFVEKMDDPSFVILNLPIQFDSLFKDSITEKERQVLKSIGKLNLLVYRKENSNPDKYFNEVAQVQKIIADKRYQHLVDFKVFEKAQGNFLFEGETDQIEEGIVFAKIDKMGFGILRILGNKLDPVELMSLSKKIDPKQLQNQLKIYSGSFEELFNSN